jgi:hypothetical protein
MRQGRGAVFAFTDIEDRLRAEREVRDRGGTLAAEQASLRSVATLVAGGAASAEVCTAVAREVASLLDLQVVAVSRNHPDGAATVIGAWSCRPGPASRSRSHSRATRTTRNWFRLISSCATTHVGVDGHYGIGRLTSITIPAEFCDARRFSSSRDAVLDITVHQSDARRPTGHLSRQSPPPLCGTLFEAAPCAPPSSPDHACYQHAAERLGGNRACLAVARRLLKQLPHAARPWRGGPAARMPIGPRALPALTPMHRGPAPGMLLPPPMDGWP